MKNFITKNRKAENFLGKQVRLNLNGRIITGKLFALINYHYAIGNSLQDSVRIHGSKLFNIELI